MRSLRCSVVALMLGVALPASLMAPVPALAQLAIGISVDVAPPPLPYYEQPPIPADGYIWMPGYWAWDQAEADYYWVPGTWVEPPQPEMLWTPAWWGWNDGRYGFHSGYWGREVGFYGGVDYGAGYTGEGYHGGRWERGVFMYNRAVNNITNVRITNVYTQPVVIAPNASRASFNGGKDGIQARPTPQQQAVDREKHIEATPAQRQHAEVAGKDRALFAKQNHGEPTVAATPRPGVLQGEGVVKASHTPVAPAGATGRPGQPPEQGQAPSQGHELPRPGQDAQHPAPGQPHAGEAPHGNDPRAADPRASEPHANDAGREPSPRGDLRGPADEPRRMPQESPKTESPKAEPPRGEARPETRPQAPKVDEHIAPPPRVEERRPEPPAAREAPAPRVEERRAAPPPPAAPVREAAPPPRAAPPPQAAAPRPAAPAPAAHPAPPHEEEKR